MDFSFSPSKKIMNSVRANLSSREVVNNRIFEYISGNFSAWHKWAACDSLICGDNPVLVSLCTSKENITGKTTIISLGQNPDPHWGFPALFGESASHILRKMWNSTDPTGVFDYSLRCIVEEGNADSVAVCKPELMPAHIHHIEGTGEHIVSFRKRRIPLAQALGGRHESLNIDFYRKFHSQFKELRSRHGYLHVLAKNILFCGGNPDWITLHFSNEAGTVIFHPSHSAISLFGSTRQRPVTIEDIHKRAILDIMDVHPHPFFNQKENKNVPCNPLS